MQLPVFRHKGSLSTQCREGTFALECTHIPPGLRPASTRPAEWPNGTVLTFKNVPHHVLINGAGPYRGGVGWGGCAYYATDGMSSACIRIWAGFLV